MDRILWWNCLQELLYGGDTDIMKIIPIFFLKMLNFSIAKPQELSDVSDDLNVTSIAHCRTQRQRKAEKFRIINGAFWTDPARDTF